MFCWLASYPRSGNTFARIVFDRVFGIRSYSDQESQELVQEGVVRTTCRPQNSVRLTVAPPLITLDELERCPRWYLAKSHLLPDEDKRLAIYLLRDGRDAVLSYAKYVLSFENGASGFEQSQFRKTLSDLILEERSPYGTWATNVSAWSQRANTCVLRFEDLISRPLDSLQRAASELGWELPSKIGEVPRFEELNSLKPKFFRSGQVNQWRTDFPEDLLCLFEERYGATLEEFGYALSRDDANGASDTQSFAA